MKGLGKLIAKGRTAEIYSLDEKEVLKLYYPSIPSILVDKEVKINQYIQDTKLPVPQFYKKVKIQKRDGLVYEKIVGQSLVMELRKGPWHIRSVARTLARSHARVHDIVAPPYLETQREWIRTEILGAEKIPQDLREGILKVLEGLPDGNQLCHGDFHPGNIMMAKDGPIIIDWITATKGAATGDVARTAVLLKTAKIPGSTYLSWLVEWVKKQILLTYLSTYFQIHPEEKKRMKEWQGVMAASMLGVGVPEEEADSMIRIVKQSLESG